MTLHELKELLAQATEHSDIGSYEEAERKIGQALSSLGTTYSMRRSEPDYVSLKLRATRLLGVVAWKRGDFNKALDLYKLTLLECEEIDDRPELLAVLGNIALAHWSLSNYSVALDYCERALSLAEQLGDIKGAAAQLGTMGNVYLSLASYPKALECYVKALRIAQDIDDREKIALWYGNIGGIYGHTLEHSKALEFYSKALEMSEEIGDKAGSARHLGNIGVVHLNLSDYPKALEYYTRALSINEEIGNKAGVATWLGNTGVIYVNLSDYPKALEYYGRALSIAETLGDNAGVANHLGNIGLAYYYLSDYPKALEYFAKALDLDEKVGNEVGTARHLGNIGLVHSDLSDYPMALQYYSKALSIDERLSNKAGVARHLVNIGNVFTILLDFHQAVEYYNRALSIDEEVGDNTGMAIDLGNLGSVYEKMRDYENALACYSRAKRTLSELGLQSEVGELDGSIGSVLAHPENPHRNEEKAEAHLLKSISVSRELHTKKYEAHKVLADLYKSQQRWKECQEQFEMYHKLKEEVQSEEAIKIATTIEQKRQIAEREKEIAIAKAVADAKHLATEELLHNVLPPTIAYRILEGENLIAEKLTNVSVLFADIVGFTPLSQFVKAEELVEGLNRIFSSFDALAEKHGLEKIKTIGDAYMVVSGAPEAREDHAEALALCAMEMIKTMKDFRWKASGEQIHIRIGIHCGDVVAGVIGKKKFAYDLWGDTVNTASRMESHGEAGKIHISDEFYFQLKNRIEATGDDFGGIRFDERDGMEIKGKGMMRTYFLERA